MVGEACGKTLIGDTLLCVAFREIEAGQCDHSGASVFMKRIANNEFCSIILSKSGRHWIYEFLFAKKDRDNIDDKELAALRKLSSAYAVLTSDQFAQRCDNGDLQEICNDDKA